MKKLVALFLIISNIFLLSGCGLFKEDKNSKLSNRGLKYYFADKEYETVTASIDNVITYNAPSMNCECDKYIRIYRNETEILFIWLGKNDDKVTSSTVLKRHSKMLSKYICSYANIDSVDVAFNLDKIAVDTVNNIERNKYVGTITGINNEGIDVELRTSMYTFVVENRPGCVVGILTGANQEDSRYNEIEANTQVMINSMQGR